MTRYIVIALLALALVAGVGGYIRAQGKQLEAQAKTIAAQGEEIGALSAANAAQEAAIAELRAAKKRDDALVAGTADKIDALSTRIQSLDRRTREALQNAPDLTLDSRLPAAAADALCLQWHAASGRIPADNPGNAPGNSVARAHDSAAPGSGAPNCHPWRKITVRNAVEWNGLLLQHAGAEREDKAALRSWAKGVGGNG